MKIAYARVSTLDQNLNRQIETLKEFGAEKYLRNKNLEHRFIIERRFKRRYNLFEVEIPLW